MIFNQKLHPLSIPPGYGPALSPGTSTAIGKSLVARIRCDFDSITKTLMCGLYIKKGNGEYTKSYFTHTQKNFYIVQIYPCE